MPDSSLENLSDCTVYIYKDNHVFVHDPNIQINRIPHQFFDIHETRFRGFDPNFIKKFPKIDGEEKEFVIAIYNHWNKYKNSDYVIKSIKQFYQERDLKKSLKITNERREAVRIFCQDHNITKLCHFTQADNLNSILEKGLLGQSHFMEGLSNDKPKINDTIRLDGYPDAISLSISFPNYLMFYKYRCNSDKDWVVLILRSDILWEYDCVFCKENAASNNVRFIDLGDRKDVLALEELFGDFDVTKRSELQIPDWFPTHPQAEVLVFDPIPPNNILEIHFEDIKILSKYSIVGDSLKKYEFWENRDFFYPRTDWRVWKQKQMSMKQDPNNPDVIDYENFPF